MVDILNYKGETITARCSRCQGLMAHSNKLPGKVAGLRCVECGWYMIPRYPAPVEEEEVLLPPPEVPKEVII